jgi:hypothetical protein
MLRIREHNDHIIADSPGFSGKFYPIDIFELIGDLGTGSV